MCGYSLIMLHCGILMGVHKGCFCEKIEKYQCFLEEKKAPLLEIWLFIETVDKAMIEAIIFSVIYYFGMKHF